MWWLRVHLNTWDLHVERDRSLGSLNVSMRCQWSTEAFAVFPVQLAKIYPHLGAGITHLLPKLRPQVHGHSYMIKYP